MPDILTKPNGSTDYQKFFMAFSAAIIVVMQGYMQLRQMEHQNRLEEIDRQLVPRAELHNNYMHKDTIKEGTTDMQRQIDELRAQLKETVEVDK